MAASDPAKKPFDPYYSWLGIPLAQGRPPDHYTLLGLSRFEQDRELIETFADKQMSFVQTFKSGPHSEVSQKILNELSQARLTLLNSERRARYDAELQAKLAASASSLSGGPPIPPPVSATSPIGGALPAAVGDPAWVGPVSTAVPSLIESPYSSLPTPAVELKKTSRNSRPQNGLKSLQYVVIGVGLLAVVVTGFVFATFMRGEPENGTIVWSAAPGVKLASATVDGKPANLGADGSLKRSIEPGVHEVVLSRTGFQNHIETVTAKPGERIELAPNWIATSGAPTVAATDKLSVAPTPSISTVDSIGAVDALAPIVWAEPIDLLRTLPLGEVEQVRAKATVSPEGIEIGGGVHSLAMLPERPQGRDYEFSTRFKRTGGHDAVVMALPIGDAACTLLVNGWLDKGGKSYLSVVDGKDAGANPDAVTGRVVEDGMEYELRATVRRMAKRRHQVVVQLNGKPLFTTIVDESSLKPNWPPGDGTRLGLGAHQSKVMFEQVRVRYPASS
ncbi:MAG TPA: hypothetical protein VGE52_22345 [Pirellulales bacterium]